MRYKNIGTPDYPCWQPVGLESFCVYPRLLPLEIRDTLPDPIQIVGNDFKIQWAAGHVSARAAQINPKFLEFVEIDLVKVGMSFVDIYGELIDCIEWAARNNLKKMNQGQVQNF